MRFDYAAMDDAFPTVVRYSGLVLTIVLIGFSLAGYYVQAAPGFVASAGMVLYKTVRDAAREADDQKDRWSHLP